MKVVLKIIKNKYLLASTIFLMYSLFLDDHDIFTIVSQKQKLSKLESNTSEMKSKLQSTQNTLEQLKYSGKVERFAREKKLFKKDDEDVFVIFYE